MLDKFFGVHPYVIRSGLWARMKPGEKDLYVYLMHQSEFICTRELKLTDEQIRGGVGLAPRTACDARKRLQEFGLIRYRASEGNKYVYTICNPETGEPYPGPPKQKAPYTPTVHPDSRARVNSQCASAAEMVEPMRPAVRDLRDIFAD